MADRGDRRVVAAAHAGRAHDAHARLERARQLREQALGAHQRAGEAVADPHRQRRRRRLAVHDDVEMGVERGDLVDLDQRKPHLVRERHEMAGVQAAVVVLQQMQVLDQEVAPARAVAEERAHLVERLRIDLPPLRRFARLAPAGAGMDAARAAERRWALRLDDECSCPLPIRRSSRTACKAGPGPTHRDRAALSGPGSSLRCGRDDPAARLTAAPRRAPTCTSRRAPATGISVE